MSKQFSQLSHTAQQCPTPLLFCQRLPRHAWGWEETKTTRLQSCTSLLLVLSHRDVSWNELHHFGPVITEGWTATSLERGLYKANKVNLEIRWRMEINQWKMDHERWHKSLIAWQDKVPLVDVDFGGNWTAADFIVSFTQDIWVLGNLARFGD